MLQKKRISKEQNYEQRLDAVQTEKIQLESRFKDADLRAEVLKKDKVILLDELNRMKDREVQLTISFEGLKFDFKDKIT